MTTALFSVGKSLIALYLSRSGVATAYGGAGAIIVVMFWVYYSVQIVLLGAELTKAYAHRYGSRRMPPIVGNRHLQ